MERELSPFFFEERFSALVPHYKIANRGLEKIHGNRSNVMKIKKLNLLAGTGWSLFFNIFRPP